MTTLLPAAASSRVPAEFLGRARAFRNRITAAEESFVVQRNAVGAALKARLQRKPSFRHPECIDLLRRWQSVRVFGQPPCDSAYLNFSKKRVEFSDFRLISVLAHQQGWADDAREPGVNLAILRLIGECTANEDYVEQKLQTIASFSLHALARYYQRAFHPSDDALVLAIWGVMRDALRIIKGDANEFTMPVPDGGGNWWGRVVTGYQTKFESDEDEEGTDSLDVRTFYTNETEQLHV